MMTDFFTNTPLSAVLNRPHFIVIGNPIAHSKSPVLHTAFARQAGIDICYNLQYCPNNFDSFLAVVEAFFKGGGTGANVTVPFKQMAFDICEQFGTLSIYAKNAGAVNTLAIKDGKLFGDNTDGRGLVMDLQHKGVDLTDKTVVILGAGGASRGAILPILQSQVARLHIANRTPQKAFELVQSFANNTNNKQTLSFSSLDDLPQNIDVIINATSIGLSDDKLPFDKQTTADVAYDMMYGKPSFFLDFFDKKGARCFDGLGMLICQGAKSFHLWTDKQVDLANLTNPFN